MAFFPRELKRMWNSFKTCLVGGLRNNVIGPTVQQRIKFIDGILPTQKALTYLQTSKYIEDKPYETFGTSKELDFEQLLQPIILAYGKKPPAKKPPAAPIPKKPTPTSKNTGPCPIDCPIRVYDDGGKKGGKNKKGKPDGPKKKCIDFDSVEREILAVQQNPWGLKMASADNNTSQIEKTAWDIKLAFPNGLEISTNSGIREFQFPNSLEMNKRPWKIELPFPNGFLDKPIKISSNYSYRFF